jgi:hypothetical protein
MGKFEGIIGIAGILGLVSFTTLIQKIYTTQNTESLPWTWIMVNIGAQILSLIYGIANNAYGIYLPNILFIAGLVYIFYVKLKGSKETKKKETKKTE